MSKQVLTPEEQVAAKILDYWFIMEFLSQDSYEECTEEKKISDNLRKFKERKTIPRSDPKLIFAFDALSEGQDIYSVISNQTDSCRMKTWGNLTFYIGRIKRQTCIGELSKRLGKTIDQAENSEEYIPVLSFQCTDTGAYIVNSLSLSPILWALSAVSGSKAPISGLLSERAYQTTVRQLEKRLFKIGSEDESIAVKIVNAKTADDKEEAEVHVEEDNTSRMNDDGEKEKIIKPVFEENAVTTAALYDIFTELVEEYGAYVCHNDSEKKIEEKYGLKYCMFVDAKHKDEYEDTYMGLSHNFFSSDIKMVKSYIEEKKYDFSSGMLSDLVKYICAPQDEQNAWKRHDYIKPLDEDTFYEEMSEILNIRNAPLGKWPSGYMPALMQQVAVNLSTPVGKRNGFGQIFSVNGPPGTGKTTLLKEVIVNNIVEKAIVLSEYDEPDKAFRGIKFKKGGIDGKYHKNFPKWFKFKDDRITDYGMLVTSSNNTAVENITKDLPLMKGINNYLFSVDGTDRMITAYKTIIVKSKEGEPSNADKTSRKIDQGKFETREFEYPDIYYTEFAREYFDQNDVWGMVTAPLGNNSNVKKFYWRFLAPLLDQVVKKNDYIDKRLKNYLDTRKEFCEQLKTVQELRDQISRYGELVLRASLAREKYKSKEQENAKLIEGRAARVAELEERLKIEKAVLDKTSKEYSDLKCAIIQITERIDILERKMNSYRAEEQRYNKEATDRDIPDLLTERVIDCVLRLLGVKSIIADRKEEIEKYRALAAECRDEAAKISRILEKERFQNSENIRKMESLQQQMVEADSIIKKDHQEKQSLCMKIRQLEEEIERCRNEACIACRERDDSLPEHDYDGTVLDKRFIQDVLSDDNETSTEAHVANPWATKRYNREREKLFFLALQLTKEFFLSSKSCRANLHILSQYWGLERDNNKNKVVFHPEESEAMIASLLNTLFLLTPVVSSAFASVARLFKDVKKPGSIGTLIIDEAGQALPQVAVGALFRARRAIIVGDPKQIEPVVKDDLRMLKDAFDEPIYANYKDKSLSAQSCADILNPVGTYYDNGTNYPDWVGCPLIVHRRCISPMYDISNMISYDGIMKQKTNDPKSSSAEKFVYGTSRWIDISGQETGNKNHYVPEQGNIVCKMVNKAFEQSGNPSLFIISPFTTVVTGICSAIRSYAAQNIESALGQSKNLNEWIGNSVGTVHKFQGKEAQEVIFVLGCDKSLIAGGKGYAVTGFVNSNIVNVAVTRAEYRIYIVGDKNVWQKNPYVDKARLIIEQSEGTFDPKDEIGCM